MQRIYLDNAATTALRPAVIETMAECMKKIYGNPSSTHVFGREAKAQIELSRKKVAELTGAHPNEIIFTSCGTESNNLIIRSAVEYLGVTRIITSDLEHKCVKETTREMGEKREVEILKVKTAADGSIDYEDLEEKLKSSNKKTLVTLMHANNEIGNLLDLEKVQKLCEENDALFHSDTVQTLGHLPLHLNDLKMDFASCSAHKFHGPKGAGFAYIKKSTGFHPQITGGGQEKNLRSGTENLYGIVGLAKALELSISELENDRQKVEGLKKYAINKLKETLPEIEFNGLSADMDQSLYTVLNIRLPFHDDLIGFELELNGIAVSQGSACSSGATTASAVMESILTPEQMEQTSPIRVSFSHFNEKEEIDTFVSVLKKIVDKHSVEY